MTEPARPSFHGFEQIPLREYAERAYLDYSMYVVLGRGRRSKNPQSLKSFVAASVLFFVATNSFAGQLNASGLKDGGSYDRFIVRFKPEALERRDTDARQQRLDEFGKNHNLSLSQLRRMAIGADVVKTDRKLDHITALRLLQDLASDPRVDYVEIDARRYPQFTPNDPSYAEQWHYFESTGGINLPAAWDKASGAGVIAAVLDTGIAPHSDLDANLVIEEGDDNPGYDFVSDLVSAGDGDGRDSNPKDEGGSATDEACGEETEPDFPVAPFSTPPPSHGTHVAGTIAAVTNNSTGVAGVAFAAKILPVRVLGRCGGFDSDISDAIVWAAGGSVPAAPANVHPAEVINMSLGGDGACSATYQDAIDFAVGAGAVIVVSAGNNNTSTSNKTPANCENLIAVAATDRQGNRASYSNFGSKVDISAPGGENQQNAADGVLSTFNSGSGETYSALEGTSMAAPHVSGVVALMQSVLVNPPADVEALLKSSARPLPGTCSGGCGAGIVNAFAAVDAANKLSNGVAETNLAASGGASLIYKMPISSSAGSVRFVTSGGSGNVDMYVNFGSPPTDSDYDYRSVTASNAETVAIATPQVGTYYVRLKANSSFSGASLTGTNYFNGTDYPIWVGGTSTSSIAVSGRSGNASSSSKVSLDIEDAFSGDIQVDLLAPDGSVYRLANAGDAGLQSYTLNLSSEPLNGTWKLRIKGALYESDDTYLGYLDLWGLKF